MPRRRRPTFAAKPPLSSLPMQRGPDARGDLRAVLETFAKEFRDASERGLRVGDQSGVIDLEYLDAVAFLRTSRICRWASVACSRIAVGLRSGDSRRRDARATFQKSRKDQVSV